MLVKQVCVADSSNLCTAASAALYDFASVCTLVLDHGRDNHVPVLVYAFAENQPHIYPDSLFNTTRLFINLT